MLLFGRLVDRMGRRTVMLTCLALFALTVYPCFQALQTRSLPLLYGVFIYTFVILSTGMSACLGALLPEMFSTEARYSGVSICYQGGSVIAGLSPLVASALVPQPGGVERLSWLIGGITLAALIALWRTAERRGQHLSTH